VRLEFDYFSKPLYSSFFQGGNIFLPELWWMIFHVWPFLRVYNLRAGKKCPRKQKHLIYWALRRLAMSRRPTEPVDQKQGASNWHKFSMRPVPTAWSGPVHGQWEVGTVFDATRRMQKKNEKKQKNPHPTGIGRCAVF